TYGNADNVSGHPLDRVCREVEQLIKNWPDRLTMASTGGPVSGHDESDRTGWQSNTRKLEASGVWESNIPCLAHKVAMEQKATSSRKTPHSRPRSSIGSWKLARPISRSFSN